MFCSGPSLTALYCRPPRLCTSRLYVNHPLQGVWAWLLQNPWQLLQITHPIPFKEQHNPETLLIPPRRQPRKISGAYFAYCWVGQSVFRNSFNLILREKCTLPSLYKAQQKHHCSLDPRPVTGFKEQGFGVSLFSRWLHFLVYFLLLLLQWFNRVPDSTTEFESKACRNNGFPKFHNGLCALWVMWMKQPNLSYHKPNRNGPHSLRAGIKDWVARWLPKSIPSNHLFAK